MQKIDSGYIRSSGWMFGPKADYVAAGAWRRLFAKRVLYILARPVLRSEEMEKYLYTFG
jgi:hypothetical protein